MGTGFAMVGRWLTPDPLGGDITNPQSLNRYAYALNNPTTLTDPLGLDSCTIDGQPGGICVTSTSTPLDEPPFYIGPCSYEAIEFAACYGGSSPAPPGWVPFPPPGGGGGTTTPPPPKPAPPPSGPSWGKTFVKSFFTNFPQTTWNSITNSNGCLNQFFKNTMSNLNPLSPGPSGVAEPLANFINALKFNSALVYAASQPNYLGGTGLLYPFKSSVFTSTLKAGTDVLEAVAVIQLDTALLQGVIEEGVSAFKGECQ